MDLLDNGVSGFLFGIICTVFLFRAFVVEKNKSETTSWGQIFIGTLGLMWILSILEIANSIWAFMQESGDYSIFYVSPTVNGFIVGVILHIVFLKNRKYSGK